MKKIRYFYNGQPIYPNCISLIPNEYVQGIDIFDYQIHLKTDNYVDDSMSFLENPYASHVFSLNNPNANSVYLFFEIVTEEDVDVLFQLKSFLLCKFWVNHQFIGMGFNNYFVNLKKGNNFIVFEHYCGQGVSYTFSCRISNLKYELTNHNSGLLCNNYSIDFCNANVIYLNNYICDGEKFEFVIVNNDNIYIDQHQIIEYRLYDYVTNREVIKGKSNFLKKVVIDTNNLYCDDIIFDYLVLEINFVNSFGVSEKKTI